MSGPPLPFQGLPWSSLAISLDAPSLAPVSLGAAPSSPPPSQMPLSHARHKQCPFLRPLELGVLTGSCQPPHPNPLPQHLRSCSPGSRCRQPVWPSVSGRRHRCVCPRRECKQSGKPQGPGHRPQGPYDTSWLRIHCVPPSHIHGGFPSLTLLPSQGALYCHVDSPGYRASGTPTGPQAPMGTLSADPAGAPGTSRHGPPRLLQPALHSAPPRKCLFLRLCPRRRVITANAFSPPSVVTVYTPLAN